MTETYEVASRDHPLHTLISWPAVFAGVAVAIATGAMLNLLGVAFGAGTANPFDLARGGDVKALSVAAGIWVAVANAIALFVGACVASRAAKYADSHRGMLHGLSVWAVAFVVAIVITGMASGRATDSALDVVQDTAGPQLGAATAGPLPAPAALPAATPRSDGTYLQADGTVTSANGTVLGHEAPPVAAMAPPLMPPAAPVVQKAADATGALALWAFLAMLLGAVGAVLGGRYGARHHTWETRLVAKETVVRTPPPII